MGYYEGDCLLDAEKITNWFRRQFPDTALPPSLERRSRDWRINGYAALASVDRYLVSIGVHPVELSEDLWLDSKESSCRRCGDPIGLQSYGNIRSLFCQPCREVVRHRSRT